ncbi:Fic family protein [Neorhizobium galegae]|uniref:Fic family protein n=1 Tax=Neorhizobium galegae TaxID=399 RepID=UPI00351D5034
MAHFWWVTIHPFDDGNGRIARAIADMVLAQSEGSHSASTACPLKSVWSEGIIMPSWRGPRRAISRSLSGCNGF